MENRMPLGLYVENGKQLRSIVTRTSGYGNFYMQPNGVFALVDGGARVIPTSEYAVFASGKRVQFATQSGPMLIIDGTINPTFSADSQSRTIRNAVCIDQQSAIHLTISKVPVSFHELATYMKHSLKCKDALYLDGAISEAYFPDQGIRPTGERLGPMIGVTEPRR